MTRQPGEASMSTGPRTQVLKFASTAAAWTEHPLKRPVTIMGRMRSLSAQDFPNPVRRRHDARPGQERAAHEDERGGAAHDLRPGLHEVAHPGRAHELH